MRTGKWHDAVGGYVTIRATRRNGDPPPEKDVQMDDRHVSHARGF
jgi:hypothetical protein